MGALSLSRHGPRGRRARHFDIAEIRQVSFTFTLVDEDLPAESHYGLVSISSLIENADEIATFIRGMVPRFISKISR